VSVVGDDAVHGVRQGRCPAGRGWRAPRGRREVRGW
jgi:hypothetical protein